MRRGLQASTRVRAGLSGEEEHQMVPCAPYRGAPCSGGRDCQPFRVSAAPTAALLMDAHAHMSRAEVIGILGGSWDAEARHMRCVRHAAAHHLLPQSSTSPASLTFLLIRERSPPQAEPRAAATGWRMPATVS
jgi:hypothetical protein